MSLVEFFAILSSVATAVYAIITYRTLKEIKIQRETTYRPDLIIDENYFNLFSADKGKGLFPNEYSYGPKREDYVEPEFGIYWLKLSIYNIGLASAKNIITQYSLDLISVISAINHRNTELATDRSVNIHIHNGFIHFDKQENSPGRSSATSVLNSIASQINHILPVSIAEHKNKDLPIPPHYLEMYAIIVHNSWIGHGANKTSPQLSFDLTLTYQDIGNKTHVKKFEITLSFYSGSEQESIHRLTVRDIA